MKKIKISLLVLCIFTICFVLTSCKKNTIDDKKIVVGASPAPHSEILEIARPYIEAQGYELEIKVYDDYIIPNLVLESGELDANYFQHLPYLEEFNESRKTNIVSVDAIHYEPLGFYLGKGTKDNYQDAKIAVPDDVTNCARALLLLASLDIIEVDESLGLNITEANITSNPYNVEIIPFEAAAIPAQLKAVDFGVINGNYAESANVSKEKLITTEDPESVAAATYGNVIAVKAGNENAEAIRVLVEALNQQEVKDYIKNTYGGYVLPL